MIIDGERVDEYDILCVVTYFWILTKPKKNENEKIQKNISKNIRKKSKNDRSEKDVGMLKKG
jgi:type II secretory pathway component PulM